MMERCGKKRTAFTLIEIMLVIGLLVVLSTIAVIGISGIKSGADKDTATLLVNQIVDAIKMYQINMGIYPDNDEGLQTLITRPDDEKAAQKWRGPYLEGGKIPIDPWNNELKYERLEIAAAGTTRPPFRVFSYGPDGQEGTDDDISSYKEGSGP